MWYLALAMLLFFIFFIFWRHHFKIQKLKNSSDFIHCFTHDKNIYWLHYVSHFKVHNQTNFFITIVLFSYAQHNVKWLTYAISLRRAFSFDQKSAKCHLLSYDSLTIGVRKENDFNFDLYEKKGKLLYCHSAFSFQTLCKWILEPQWITCNQAQGMCTEGLLDFITVLWSWLLGNHGEMALKLIA